MRRCSWVSALTASLPTRDPFVPIPIQIEWTPNPDAIRILPGIPLAPGATLELTLTDDVTRAPLAAAIFQVPGVARLLIGRDFITIVRASHNHQWAELKPELLMVIANFVRSGDPAIYAIAEDVATDVGSHGEIARHIREVIDRYVAPMLARDGGEAALTRFDAATGVAYIRMGGACGGCPSGKMTLERGIEMAIKRYVPEVTKVVEAEKASSVPTDPKARFRGWVATRFPSYGKAR